MRRSLAVAFAVVSTFSMAPSPASAGGLARAGGDRNAIVFLVDGVSFDQLMGMRPFRELAAAGGAALLSPRTVPDDGGTGAYVTLGAGARSSGPPHVHVRGARRPRVADFAHLTSANAGHSTPGLLASVLEAHGLSTCAAGDLQRALLVAAHRTGRGATPGANRLCPLTVVAARGADGKALEKWVRLDRGPECLVVALEAAPTVAMDRIKDEVTPIVMALGDTRTMLEGRGPMRTLTSDTTRRVGLVSNEDVAPTVLRFFHIPIPAEMNGSPIRIVHAPPPFRMHARHLANRRTSVPLSVAIVLAASAIGIAALWANLRRPPASTRSDRTMMALLLSVPAVGAAALAAGSLPVLTYAWLVPFLVLSSLAGAALGLAFRRRGPLVPTAVVAAGILVFFVVEALRGWPDTLFPALGGSALDGARFYGLPNTYIGLALTLFAAAGLWVAFRLRRRLGWKEALLALGVVVVGLALVFAANVLLTSAPTHATRFVEGAGQRGVLHTVAERLGTSWRLLTRYPATWIIAVGLPLTLWTALRPPRPMRAAFDRHPEWRDAMVVLVLASMVAFVGNDTGAAAAGFGFGLAVAGILYLPIAERATSRATRAT